MTEKQLQERIVRTARRLGWRDAWTWKSIHSPKGWPDLVLAKGLRLLIVELKSETGKVTPEQQTWLDWWRTFAASVTQSSDTQHGEMCVSWDPPHEHAAVEVYVWKPADIGDAYEVLER